MINKPAKNYTQSLSGGSESAPPCMNRPAAKELITPALTALADAICDPTALTLTALENALSGSATLDDDIEAAYFVTEEEMILDSPVEIPADPEAQKAAILNIFDPGDLVFVQNEVTNPEKQGGWKPLSSIRVEDPAPVTTISPWVIAADGQVAGWEVTKIRRLLVITGAFSEDEPPPGAVFRFLSVHVGLRLLAVTSDITGNHGIFEPLTEELVNVLARVLPEFLPAHELSVRTDFDERHNLLLPGALPYVALLYLSSVNRQHLITTDFDS